MEAAEGNLVAMTALRELICVNHINIPHAMSAHVKRAINKNAAPFKHTEWGSLSRPRMVETMLRVVRNSLLAFLEAKELVEFHEDNPLYLPRRQAIIQIGQMACHGNELAHDYLLDKLCQSKEWSTRQLSLAQSSRVLIVVDQRDKADISSKLLRVIFETEEHVAVRETSESVLIEALKGGLSKDKIFLDSFMKMGMLALQAKPTQQNKEAWERIKAGAHLTTQTGVRDSHQKKHDAKETSVHKLRERLTDQEIRREKAALEARMREGP